MTTRPDETPVFLVIAEQPEDAPVRVRMTQAVRFGVSGSWWHVRHSDGTTTSHNGGSVRRPSREIPGALGERYRESPGSAFADAVTQLMRASYSAGHRSEWPDQEHAEELMHALMEACTAWHQTLALCTLAVGGGVP